MKVNGQLNAQADLPPGKSPNTLCTGDWESPRTNLLDGLTPPGLERRTVTCRYID